MGRPPPDPRARVLCTLLLLKWQSAGGWQRHDGVAPAESRRRSAIAPLPVPRGARSAGAEEERGVLAGAERQEEQEGAEEGAVSGGAAPMLLLLPARLDIEDGERTGVGGGAAPSARRSAAYCCCCRQAVEEKERENNKNPDVWDPRSGS
jgi:hypothetical protein